LKKTFEINLNLCESPSVLEFLLTNMFMLNTCSVYFEHADNKRRHVCSLFYN